jgi:hypothetical protein
MQEFHRIVDFDFFPLLSKWGLKGKLKIDIQNLEVYVIPLLCAFTTFPIKKEKEFT